MKINHVWAIYFSGTGTTKTVVRAIAQTIAEQLDAPLKLLDFTSPTMRSLSYCVPAGDLAMIGTPVIAGRVPNVLLPFLNKQVRGEPGAMAVPVVLYGNRNYDDALMELREILEADGFRTVAGAAFIGEHSFSRTLAAGRPDARDMEQVRTFAAAVADKVDGLTELPAEPIPVKGELPLRPYYTPRDRHGNHINILKVTPKTRDTCIQCGRCAVLCPMGSIRADDVTRVDGICIKCCACVKGCPVGAKYYDDPGYLYHQHELEALYARRAEPEWFL
jgi:ferredoxin